MRHKFLGIGEPGYHPVKKIRTVISGLRYAIIYDWSVTWKLVLSVFLLGLAFLFREWIDVLLILLATAFVLVATPQSDVVRDAVGFTMLLDDAGIPTDAVVVNRVHPRFARSVPTGLDSTPLAPFATVLADAVAIADAEDSSIAPLVDRPDRAVARVPLLAADVHDLPGLAALGPLLVGDAD